MIIAKFDSDGRNYAIMQDGERFCLLCKLDGIYTQVSDWCANQSNLFVKEVF